MRTARATAPTRQDIGLRWPRRPLPAVPVLLAVLVGVGVVGSITVHTIWFDRFALLTQSDQEIIAADVDLGTGTGGFEAEPVGGEAFLRQYQAGTAERYGGVEFRILEARAVPENRSGLPIVVVDLEAVNTTDIQIRLPEGMFRLHDRDGTLVPANRFEFTRHSTRLVLDGGTRQEAAVVFRLKPGMQAYLPQFTMEIGDVGRQPAELTLVPNPGVVRPYRGRLDVTSPNLMGGVVLERSTSGPDGLLSGTISGLARFDIAVIDGYTDFDYGVFRAGEGKRLVAVTSDVSIDVATGGGVSGDQFDPLAPALDPSWWRLHDGTTATHAIRVEVLERSKTDARLRVVAEAPLPASSLSVLAGGDQAGNVALLTRPVATATAVEANPA